jgi:hypothetical protein
MKGKYTMKNVKNFILKSKKIYAILGVAIMVVACVLIADISYDLGQTNKKGYSEEYLQAYGLHVWAYTEAGTEFETATEWAKNTCDLFIGN